MSPHSSPFCAVASMVTVMHCLRYGHMDVVRALFVQVAISELARQTERAELEAETVRARTGGAIRPLCVARFNVRGMPIAAMTDGQGVRRGRRRGKATRTEVGEEAREGGGGEDAGGAYGGRGKRPGS